MADEKEGFSSFRALMRSQEALNSDAVDFTTAYALYRYNANRPCHVKDTKRGSLSSTDASVMDFLQKEAVADGNFSLSMITTSLGAEYEKELRLMIATRLSKGTVYSGSGNIAALKVDNGDDKQPIALCYYCLLRQGTPPDVLSSDSEVMTTSYCSNEFVVCFLTKPDIALDLFRPELDKYAGELVSLLDADPLVFFELDEKAQTQELAEAVSPHLECWTFHVMESLTRCVSKLQEDVKFLLYAALVDANIRVVTPENDDQLKKDIQKFVMCCSLSELLSQVVSDTVTPASTPLVENGPALPAPAINITDPGSPLPSPPDVILTITPDSYSFENQDCTEFCASWAQALLSGDIENAVFLRQVIENYKLKTIQDMNSLKRLIRQAETDHYALYRSYVFLKKSGNGMILLRHARLEHHSVTSQDAQDVLSVLSDYIQNAHSAIYR